MMNRFAMLWTTLFLVSSAHGDDITLVRDGRPRALIVVSRDARDQVRSAAATLAKYIERASGAKLEVVSDDKPAEVNAAVVFVGAAPSVEPVRSVGGNLDDDGFVIRAKDNQITICGPTDWGTEFGVYEFLERFVGVRWLLPGPDGDDVPAAGTIRVPEGTITDQPAVSSRLFSGLRGDWQTRWARFNRMHGRLSFHHNLLNVFPPETYTKTHPEFFPMRDGKTRYLPPTNNTHGWQPCFSAKGSVEEAIKNINRYFDRHPEATSFSLGVNDSSGYCRCPQCLNRVPKEPNFLGRADYSDLYYDWCNRVIEGVLKKHPDKWFGCLAYSEVAAPPKHVQVHERLVPFMTYDRMKWIQPEVRAAGHAVTEAWEKVSPALGWYDYIYGTPYCLPRVYFHQTQKYLRYGVDHGVRACYAELYPNWGEGPKPYLYLKLWWNPQADVDALLKEWYVRCVGREAAPYLAKYYEIWERFWTKDILDSPWFSPRGQYCNFSSPAYLAQVKQADIHESRRLLEACLARCKTDKQRARARLLEKAFEYYEASALAYLADHQLPPTMETEAQALTALDGAVTGMVMATKRRRLALEVYPKDPVLLHPLTLERYGALSGETWGGNGMWAAMSWVLKGDNPVRKRVVELAQSSKSERVREQAALMLAIADGRTTPVSKNPSFEEGEGNLSADWSYWVKPDPVTKRPVGRMLRSTDHAHAGKYSLLCDAMYRGGPVNTIRPLPPGKYCALAWVFVDASEGADSKGTCELVITPRDDDGRNLPGPSTKITPPLRRWTLIVAGGEIKQEIKGKEVTHALMIPIVTGFRNGGKVYWDEVALYRVGETK